MAVSEQARLATVEDHVRGENARDLDVIMDTFSANDGVAVVYKRHSHYGTSQDPKIL
jgi:hypothetical protein